MRNWSDHFLYLLLFPMYTFRRDEINSDKCLATSKCIEVNSTQQTLHFHSLYKEIVMQEVILQLMLSTK